MIIPITVAEIRKHNNTAPVNVHILYDELPIEPIRKPWGFKSRPTGVTNQKADSRLDISWHEHAACIGADPNLFYPERGHPSRDAQMVCGRCAVRLECLNYAIVNFEKYGVWGGLSARQRRRMTVKERLNLSIRVEIRTQQIPLSES